MRDWIDEFLMVGNQPALDLLNTSLMTDHGPMELLGEPRALGRWLVAVSLSADPRLRSQLPKWIDSPQAADFLRELIAFRECLRKAVLRIESGKSPATFLNTLNELLQRYPQKISLAVRKGGTLRKPVFSSSMADALWTQIAAFTADLLTDVPPERIRRCEACTVHFMDVSKKGSRRWCSMNLCGNKIKVAAYQRRQRTATG